MRLNERRTKVTWCAAACLPSLMPASPRMPADRANRRFARAASGGPERKIYPVSELRDCLAQFSEPRNPFAGMALSGADAKPLVMGVLNVTPDSFSDGGDYEDSEGAIAHGRALHAAGADIVDIGGESTRPGADPVPVDIELARAIPVVAALAGDGIPVSIDTRRAPVMREAIAAGRRRRGAGAVRTPWAGAEPGGDAR